MSDAPSTRWTSWTADDPPSIGFARVDRASGSWEAGPLPYFAYRDLDLDRASGGRLSCRHLRASREPRPDEECWQAHDVDLQFLYVLAGTIVLHVEGSEPRTLGVDDTVIIPTLLRHALLNGSADFEAVEILAPARYETAWGKDAALPARAASLDPLRAVVLTDDAPARYLTGAGPRSFFEYRDTGTRGPTEGRIHIHVVHAIGTPVEEGTGWHYHSMAQWFMVLEGSADIRVEDQPRQHLRPLDCMCIGSGERMRHNVDRVSADYKVLEMCVPADYTTVAVAAPADAAA